MRTTLNIDDDVLLAVRDRAGREGRTAGDVLSELARQTLTAEWRSAHPAGVGRRGFRPLPHRGSVVSNALIDRLRQGSSD